MTDTDTRAIIETARLSTTPHLVEPGCLYVVPTDSGYTTIDLTGDRYLELPRRKTGTVTVHDVASFAQYYGKHSDAVNGASEVFADLDQATVTAVLNAHGADAADWQDHRVTLAMRKTEQWKAWTASDSKMMPQTTFAEFIEDHAADVTADNVVSAADLLEIAQHFQAHTKVTFSSGKRLDSGQTQFVYSEDTTAGAGKNGTLVIPTEFEVGLQIFDDCPAYRIRARFRYRINDGALVLGYHLDDPQRAFRKAVEEMVEQVEDACKIQVMRGRPA